MDTVLLLKNELNIVEREMNIINNMYKYIISIYNPDDTLVMSILYITCFAIMMKFEREINVNMYSLRNGIIDELIDNEDKDIFVKYELFILSAINFDVEQFVLS